MQRISLMETHGDSDEPIAEWIVDKGKVVITHGKIQINGMTVALYEDRHYYATKNPAKPSHDDLEVEGGNEIWIE